MRPFEFARDGFMGDLAAMDLQSGCKASIVTQCTHQSLARNGCHIGQHGFGEGDTC